MIPNNYECDGQLDFSTMELPDYTYDRAEAKHKAPKWMNKERCENCVRWARYAVDEQPPCGWGIKGWCNAHNQKSDLSSYCQSFERRGF